MDNNATIIKKIKKGGHGAPHGGAWKVAYADFVTAMMAFFLLLWLLNATTEEQKMGISNYFDPTAISRSARSGSGGVLGGTTVTTPGALKSSTSPPMISSPIVSRPAFDPGKEQDPDAQEAQKGIGDAQAGEKGADVKQFVERGTELKKPAEVLSGQVNQNFTGLPIGDANKDKSGSVADDTKPGNVSAQSNPGSISQEQLEKMMAEREDERLRQTMEQVRQAIQEKIDLKDVADQVRLEVTPEGLRIQLVDQEKSSMFPLGSPVMQDNARRLMDQVARIVKDLPNKITISGHTDSLPYRGGSGGYSNWELSADRANASRRALVASGVPDNRIALVVGKADTDPLIAENPAAAQNRRISIVVLRNDPKASVGRQSGAPAAGPPTQLANRPNDASQAPQGPGRPAPAAAAPVRRQ